MGTTGRILNNLRHAVNIVSNLTGGGTLLFCCGGNLPDLIGNRIDLGQNLFQGCTGTFGIMSPGLNFANPSFMAFTALLVSDWIALIISPISRVPW